MGTGRLIFCNRVDTASVRPLETVGTGNRSSEETQPDFLPDKFESSTPNVPGLAGLKAGIGAIATGAHQRSAATKKPVRRA